ncbi:hypothetical protein GCM10007863_35840 [Dyella mobilis]|nr:hypothetical protein GCM10007863_35840 [Dyella mobilis]
MIGFYATRFVRAANSELAEQLAKESVLSEWRPGGLYSDANKGGIPLLITDSVASVSLLTGIRKRRAKGYTFYLSD